MVGRRVGRFRIVSKLGQGGLATVWKAHDELLGRCVALKILDQKLAESGKARRRFLHDAQTAAALDHPGIVSVFDTGEAEGLVYIALSLIDGDTLSELAARRLLPIDEAVRIVTAAAEALGHAHDHGVVHRDVTGRNIMIARDGRVIVLDFGLALAAWESRVTTSETIVGTATYMAPEVIQGAQADPRSDLYGLGVVLYEALTGTYPFRGDQRQVVLYAATNTDPDPPGRLRPEIPAGLERVVLKAIARDPAARYQTAPEMIADLRALVSHDPKEAATRLPAPDADLRTAGGYDPAMPASRSRSYASDPVYLAVLPFEADSAPDPEGACARLAERLPETVSCAVATETGVRVLPVPRSPLPAEPRDIARLLGANVLMRGSVRRAGSQVRVSYSLLDPWRGVQVAGDVIDGSALDVLAYQQFEIEDRVVASVRRALGIAGGEEKPSRSGRADPVADERLTLSLSYLRRRDNLASVEGAITILQSLIATQEDRGEYHAALARALLVKHDLTKERRWKHQAAAACQRARELDPDAAGVHVAHGDLLFSGGAVEAALTAYREALDRRPGDFDAMLGEAHALSVMGRHDEAKRAFAAAIAIRPDDWRGHSLLGQALFRALDYPGALECWRKVVELAPDNALGRRNVGSVLYKMDRFEEAVAAYRESLAIQPNAIAFTNLGTTLYFLGRFQESADALRKAARLAPNDPDLWGNLGNVCDKIPGCESEAAEALDRAIALMRERLASNSSDGEGWARLSGYFMSRGLHEEGERAIRQALSVTPEDPFCLYRAALLYLQLGDRERGYRFLDDAVRHGYSAGEIERSVELAPFRTDPEFQRIVHRRPAREAETRPLRPPDRDPSPRRST